MTCTALGIDRFKYFVFLTIFLQFVFLNLFVFSKTVDISEKLQTIAIQKIQIVY